MTPMKELTLSYGDVGITAAAFDVFWQRYAAAKGDDFYYSRVSAERVCDVRALVEYQIVCWYKEESIDDEPRRCALIRFQSLPGNRQRLTCYYQRPYHDPEYDYSATPALSEQEVGNIFDSFIAYLHNEGYLEERPQDTMPIEDEAGDREPTDIGSLLSDVTTMRQHYVGYNPATAKEIIAAATEAADLFDREGGRWGPKKFESFCGLTSTTIGRYFKAFRAVGLTETADGIKIPGRGVKEPY